jgi:anti-sigma regulatory factor (Ser/Thr protein kinase)
MLTRYHLAPVEPAGVTMSVEAYVEARHGHVVDFYAHDLELADRVSRFLIDGLGAGEIVIIVSTPEHRSMFESAIVDAGIDLAAARSIGSLVSVDAAELLDAFSCAGQIDGARFDAVIGSLLRANAGERRIRVFGEMVQLLWDRKEFNGALTLESLWNDLGRELDFLLYCAYRSSDVDEQLGALESICELHSAVVGGRATSHTPWSEHAEFAGQPESARAARRFVLGVCERRGLASAAPEVELVVAELTANAVVHARSPFSVEIGRDGNTVRIAVCDTSRLGPVRREFNAASTSGRGIAMVEALAQAWGCDLGVDGKQVWAELVV